MKKELSFEGALKALEDIVENLEGGDLTLAQSLEFFEEGVGLTKFCSQTLERAEGKIEIIKEEDGQKSVVEFDGDSKGDN